ncbi:hypothetical protein WJ0W_003173 [Paenibacillus melissococcoides]|uniref:Uncharacterized protein n=1 Tax=Paenibacillus melissococcoides TaxID=2912268 RepID=A0ABN8U4C9_9BACL|nr:hypothetical protein WJ0W_003173 [Paenibacillus melissococcoides]
MQTLENRDRPFSAGVNMTKACHEKQRKGMLTEKVKYHQGLKGGHQHGG